MIRLEDIFIIDFGDYKKKEKMYKTDDRQERKSHPRRPNLSTPSSFVIWRAPDFRFERLQALAQNGVGGFDVAR